MPGRAYYFSLYLQNMKVAILGYGNVGIAAFHTFIHMPEIHELVLCGRNRNKIEGELADFRDSLALNSDIKTRIRGGGYEMTAGADIIVYTVGPTIKDHNTDRRTLAQANIDIAREVSEELNKYNRDAIIIVISNPVDIVVSALMKYTGRQRGKVIGTGTLLDSARLRRYLADMLDIQPKDVSAYVLGEHGNSSCIVWRWTSVMGMPVEKFLSSEIGAKVNLSHDKLLEVIRRAGLKIVEKKGHTSFGVAAAAAQIASAIIHDTHQILVVSVPLSGEYGIDGVALSVPCYVNSCGATVIASTNMTDDELDALNASAEAIRNSSCGFL